MQSTNETSFSQKPNAKLEAEKQRREEEVPRLTEQQWLEEEAEKRGEAEQQKQGEEEHRQAELRWLEEEKLRHEEEKRVWAEYRRSEDSIRRQLIEKLRSVRAEQSQREAKLKHEGRQREVPPPVLAHT